MYLARTRVLLALAVVLLAQPATADLFDKAREVFGEAERLYGEGKYGQAAEKYEATFRMARMPALFFNIGQARRLQFKAEGNAANLVAARNAYQRFLKEGKPSPALRGQALTNLREVETAAVDEARRQFMAAEQAMKLGRYATAITGYEAAYDLTGRPALLFNLAQANRRQFSVDRKLERLNEAERQLLTFRREAPGKVAPEVIDQLLNELKAAKAEYHRRRQAESRAKEPKAMREARELYGNGDMAGTVRLLLRAETAPKNDRLILSEIYRLRGQAEALVANRRAAVDAFKLYLALEPADDGTGLRPEALPFFREAQAFWKDKEPLRLDHLAPGKVPPGKKVIIPVRVASDPLGMVARLELRYRRRGTGGTWEEAKVLRDKERATLPSQPMPLTGKDDRIEYYVVALNVHGAVIDSLGTKAAPLAFLVSESALPKPPPWYKRWWVWAAAGTVVAGVITAVAITTHTDLPDLPVVGDVSRRGLHAQ